MYLPLEIYIKKHLEAQACYICHKPFTEKNYKVKDHNHLTGEYRGPAHNRCNLANYKICKIYPSSYT